jgi:hypothetical protein
MALSPEEVSRINRQNAARSTGPSQANRRKTRMNSTVHGLRASKVVLPNESEQEIQTLMDEWTEHYRPTSPGRRALVDRAVMATVHHQRSKRYLKATLGTQVRGARRAFDEEQEDIVEHYTRLLPVDAPAAVRGLRRTAAGCRWALREWLALETHLIEGIWTPSCRERATRLLGHNPDDLKDEVSYDLLYLTVSCSEQVPPEVQASLLDPRTMPDTLLSLRDRPLPPPDESFAALVKVVEGQIAEYEALAKELRIEVEEPAREAAVEKAMLLNPEDLKLWIRYERMHDSMFHRSYNTLERPEAPQPETDEAVPGETAAPPDPAPEPQSPCEEASPSGAAVSATATEPPSNDGPAAARTAETDDPAVTSAAGPVVTGDPVVERQTKRVATVAPALLGSPDEIDAGAAPDPAPTRHGTPGRDEAEGRDPAAAELASRWRAPPVAEAPDGVTL